jgi:hypothetical protein
MQPVIRNGRMLHEATRLAADGELGNSDAIALLQIPHHPEELKEVLSRFARQLTREARSKLTLAAFAPLPDNVINQRYEPIFDRYPITGKTYKTAAGTVVLNEVQYYNGQMVQLYGECTNVESVARALAKSGYKPLTMTQPDGRESAVVQFWSHQLTDTSIKPYNAMFIIVAAVPDDAPACESSFKADANGVSSVLSMFDGRVDPITGIYQNRARLWYVRLLDSTQVAIDVGRERMGTDKRPGTIELTRTGEQLRFSIANGDRRPVARITVVPSPDPAALLPELSQAAATAGIALHPLPPGTEYVYPGIARIGMGPVVGWQWRTDVVPRFQAAMPDTIVFDPSSEEGRMLIDWGFRPAVLGYIPNVRGVVTGVPENAASRPRRVRIEVPTAPVVRRPARS